MRTKNWLSGIIFGSLVGAGVALLTASRSGQETRKMISEKGNMLRDKAMSTVEDTRSRVEELATNVVGDTRDRVDQLKDVGRRVAQKESVVLKEGVQDAQQVMKS